MSGTTDQFLESRKDGNAEKTLSNGVWYSGFNRVKEHAIGSGIPFFAVWSNGDDCSLCKKIEKNFMTDVFTNWMASSPCVFWFGYSKDKATEDRVDGKKWTKDNKLKVYPFIRLYWENGSVAVNVDESGSWWNGGKAGNDGAINIINRIEDALGSIRSVNRCLRSRSAKLKIRVNPEWTKEEVSDFRKKIKANGGYCPCVEEHTPDTKCMCKWFRDQKTAGECHCGLYEKFEV